MCIHKKSKLFLPSPQPSFAFGVTAPPFRVQAPQEAWGLQRPDGENGGVARKFSAPATCRIPQELRADPAPGPVTVSRLVRGSQAYLKKNLIHFIFRSSFRFIERLGRRYQHSHHQPHPVPLLLTPGLLSVARLSHLTNHGQRVVITN